MVSWIKCGFLQNKVSQIPVSTKQFVRTESANIITS